MSETLEREREGGGGGGTGGAKIKENRTNGNTLFSFAPVAPGRIFVTRKQDYETTQTALGRKRS